MAWRAIPRDVRDLDFLGSSVLLSLTCGFLRLHGLSCVQELQPSSLSSRQEVGRREYDKKKKKKKPVPIVHLSLEDVSWKSHSKTFAYYLLLRTQ